MNKKVKKQLGYIVGTPHKVDTYGGGPVYHVYVQVDNFQVIDREDDFLKAADYGQESLVRAHAKRKLLISRGIKSTYERDYGRSGLDIKFQGSKISTNFIWYAGRIESASVNQESFALMRKLLGKEIRIESLEQLLARLGALGAKEMNYESFDSGIGAFIELKEPSKNLVDSMKLSEIVQVPEVIEESGETDEIQGVDSMDSSGIA